MSPEDEEFYESELARIQHSGPHEMDDEKRQFNREVKEMLGDVLPIDDIHKVSDCDLIYRFLIAKRWNTEQAADGLRAYAKWREEMNLNDILWEEFPDDSKLIAPEFRGCDRNGHPVFYDRPNPKVISELLNKYPRELCLRVHFKVMEWGRRLMKIHNTDRVSCFLDMAQLSMGIVANPKAMGFLKEISHMDQTMYPENMRTMLIVNGGWSFNALWKVIRPLLDVRVQKKIQFMSGNNTANDIDAWIDLEEVPIKYGGTDVSNPRLDDDEGVKRLPKGTAPPRPKKPEVEEEKSRDLESAPVTTHNIEKLNAENLASPLDGAAYDSGDEFQSIPTDDEEDESDVYVPPSPEVPKEIRQQVTSPLGRGVVPGVVSMTVTVTPSPGGGRTTFCHVDGEMLAETSGNLIVGVGNHLFGEIVAESGHPLHTYLLIADASRAVKFILKRRNLHKKISIFTVTGDSVIQTTKKMKHTCKGERTHVLNCIEGSHSADKRDWAVWPVGLLTKRVQAEKHGDVITFQDQLPQYPTAMLFALAVGLTELWHYGE